jgi:hypothetical protein
MSDVNMTDTNKESTRIAEDGISGVALLSKLQNKFFFPFILLPLWEFIFERCSKSWKTDEVTMSLCQNSCF